VTGVDTVPELAALLCAAKTLFAVFVVVYEIPRGTQLFTNYVSAPVAQGGLGVTITHFLDPRCASTAPPPPPTKK